MFGISAPKKKSLAATATLFNVQGLPLPGAAAGGMRLLNSAYMPGIANASKKCLRVGRASDNAEIDVGFDSSGNRNDSAISSHCAGTTGYVTVVYSQTGDNHNVTFAVGHQPIVYESGAVVTVGGKPAMRVPDGAVGGVTAAFAAITGTTATLCFVGSMTQAVTSLSPPIVSLLPVNTSLTDSDISGIRLLGRDGSATPTANWLIRRNNVKQVEQSTTYGQLDQVTTQLNGQSYSVTVNGNTTSVTGTTGTALNAGRVGICHSGSAAISMGPSSGQQQYLCEWLVWGTALSQQQINVVRANQRAYYGTPADSAASFPESAGFTLKAKEDFAGGVWRSQDWVIYNNGHMTDNAGAWMSRDVSLVQLTDAPYAGEWALEFRSVKNTTVQTLADGFSFILEGGAGYWKGPPDGDLGAAFQQEGLWRAVYRWVGKGVPAAPSRGHGWADLLWPYNTGRTGSFPENWPIHNEPDINEVTPGNTNKTGGESNWHLDTVKGSSRHQRQPPTSGTISTYPNLFTGVPAADIAAQNYGRDWKTWQTVDCVVKTGAYQELFLNGVSRGRINYTASNPRPFVEYNATASDGTPIPRKKRRTFQTEGLGVSDANRQPGTFALQVKLVAYYSLP